MIIIRKVRKVGNSLMIPLPPETLSESGFKEGMEVAIGSRPGHVDLDPAGRRVRLVATLRTPVSPGGSPVKKLLLLLVVIALGAVIAKKVRAA